MKNKLGVFLMVLGSAALIAALTLSLLYRSEEKKAGEVSQQVVEKLEQYEPDIDEPAKEETDSKMTEVLIDGNYYIGYVQIPDLNLKLPVMSDWSYDKLLISPCRYYGSVKTDDFVIAAHNYTKHFGRFRNLSVGAEVYFTDMDGSTYAYEVAEVDILQPNAVEEMTSGEYPLTLFTCTYGGRSRITVRCIKSEK